MERVLKSTFIVMSLIFGAVLGDMASADKASAPETQGQLVSLIHDMRIAQEANDLNSNTWNQDVANTNEDGLTKIENLLSQGEDFHNHTRE